MGWADEESEFDSRKCKRRSRLLGVTTGFGSHAISHHTGSVVSSLRVRRPERQDDPSPQSGGEVKYAWSHTSIRNIRSYSVFKIL